MWFPAWSPGEVRNAFSWKFTDSWGASAAEMEISSDEDALWPQNQEPPRCPPCPERCSRMCNHYLGFPHVYTKNYSFSIWNSHIAGHCFTWHPTADLQRGAFFAEGICGSDLCSLDTLERWPSFCFSYRLTLTLAWKASKQQQAEKAERKFVPLCGLLARSSLRRFGLELKGGNLGLLPLRSLLKAHSHSNLPWKSKSLSRWKGRKPI